MTNARILQLTNSNIPAVATNTYMPLGTSTVVYPFDTCNYYPTYTVTSSSADTLVVNKPGVYNFIYNASVTATAAGEVSLVMVVNGVQKYTSTVTATADGVVNITVPYEVYIPANCASSPGNVPAYIQILSTGVALTEGTSNLIITKQ